MIDSHSKLAALLGTSIVAIDYVEATGLRAFDHQSIYESRTYDCDNRFPFFKDQSLAIEIDHFQITGRGAGNDTIANVAAKPIADFSLRGENRLPLFPIQ